MNKIEKIVAALNIIEPDHVADDREAFKEKFNKRHGKKILKLKETQKKSFYYYIGKVACWVISISIVFAGANTITGLATGRTICDRVVDVLRSVEYTYYETGQEKVVLDEDSKFHDNTDVTASFPEIREKTEFNFLLPKYIPNGYREQSRKAITETSFLLMCTYAMGEDKISYQCQAMEDSSNKSIGITGAQRKSMRINDFNVIVYTSDENIMMLFDYDGLVYTISSTNLSLENEIVKMIESMKGSI